MNFWDRLDRLAADWNVLEHPFYARWSRGELTREELAAYSGQYRHAVVALAGAAGASAAPSDARTAEHLREHAAEEAEHVELWDRFVGAVGGDSTAPAAPETALCAAAWAREGRSSAATLAALYAIESAQPAIAETKLRGLVEHYGFDADDAGSAYFALHAERDVEHAEEALAALAAAPDLDGDRVVAAAEEALRANWLLLDGVVRAA